MPVINFIIPPAELNIMLPKITAIFTNIFHESISLNIILVLIRLFVNSLIKTLLKYFYREMILWTTLTD